MEPGFRITQGRQISRWGVLPRAILLFALLLLTAIASASGPDIKKEIQKQYDRWSIAYMANDVDTLLEILSPDYSLTNFEKETMNYKTFVAYLNLRKSSPRDITQYKTTIKGLKMKGQIAEVDAVESMKLRQAEPNTGRMMLSIHSHEYIDRWSHSGNGWRLLSTTTILESTKTQKPG